MTGVQTCALPISYLRAVRRVGAGSLHLAHVNKSDTGDQKPFGSSWWFNGARAVWFAKRSEPDGNSRSASIGLIHRKANLGPLQPTLAFEFTFSRDGTSVQRVEPSEVAGIAENLSLAEKMKAALMNGPMTPAQLAEEVGAKANSVNQTARRHERMFVRQAGPDGTVRLKLVQRVG